MTDDSGYLLAIDNGDLFIINRLYEPQEDFNKSTNKLIIVKTPDDARAVFAEIISDIKNKHSDEEYKIVEESETFFKIENNDFYELVNIEVIKYMVKPEIIVKL